MSDAQVAREATEVVPEVPKKGKAKPAKGKAKPKKGSSKLSGVSQIFGTPAERASKVKELREQYAFTDPAKLDDTIKGKPSGASSKMGSRARAGEIMRDVFARLQMTAFDLQDVRKALIHVFGAEKTQNALSVQQRAGSESALRQSFCLLAYLTKWDKKRNRAGVMCPEKEGKGRVSTWGRGVPGFLDESHNANITLTGGAVAIPLSNGKPIIPPAKRTPAEVLSALAVIMGECDTISEADSKYAGESKLLKRASELVA